MDKFNKDNTANKNNDIKKNPDHRTNPDMNQPKKVGEDANKQAEKKAGNKTH